jgi:hypothetical protein
VSDFYENGRRRWFRLLEKGGKHHEVPVHHKAQDYVAEYLEKAGFEPNKAALSNLPQENTHWTANVAIGGLPNDPPPSACCRHIRSGVLPFIPRDRNHCLLGKQRKRSKRLRK